MNFDMVVVVKRYEEETNLRCRIILDISSSMYFPKITKETPLNKLGFSIYALASLIEILKKQRDGLELALINSEIQEDINEEDYNSAIVKLDEFISGERHPEARALAKQAKAELYLEQAGVGNGKTGRLFLRFAPRIRPARARIL